MAPVSEAGVKTWNNSGTAWATGANWVGGVAPASDLTIDQALFNNTTFNFQPNFGSTSINGILVGDGSTATGPLSLTGSILTLGSGGIVIAPNAGTVSLSNSVKLGANQSWANNSSSLFTVGATVTNAATSTPYTLTLSGSGSGGTSFTNVISNFGTGTTSIVVNTTGGGKTTFSANNTYTGGLTINSGIVQATTSTGALGGGAVTLGGGELQLANDTNLGLARAVSTTGNAKITLDRATSGAGVIYTLSTLSTGAQTLTVAGGSNVTSGTTTLNFNGAVTLGGGSTFNVTNPSSGASTFLTLSGVVGGGANGFTKTGDGTLLLSGASANTYTGLTTVSGGELQLNKTTGINAVAGNLTVGNGKVTLLANNQIADTGTVSITTGGTFSFNAKGDTIAALTISSTGATATLDLGNQTGSTTFTLGSGALTFGANTQLLGGGLIRKTGGGLTLNFDGGQVNNSLIYAGSSDAGTVINVTQGMGSGTFMLGNTSGTNVATLNLNQTGTMNLGSTFIGYSNSSGGSGSGLAVNVAASATGLTGGGATVALISQTTPPQTSGTGTFYNSGSNSLTFASGASQAFTLSGSSIIDVRSTGTAYGTITTNGRNIVIAGGTLLGNKLGSSTGAWTLSSGYFGLKDVRNASAENFTISTADGNDGHTIKMLSGNTGTFTVANGLSTATSHIIVGSFTDGGIWDRGTLNAGSNYTISADAAGNSSFGSNFNSFTIGDNSGLNGIYMGSSAVPTTLTLGSNASFFGMGSTAASRTYNVGASGGGNDIIAPTAGNFTFGINNTSSSSNQIINLNQDKGNYDVTLIATGASTSDAINIAANQTGSGNLYVLTRNLTINSGVTFGGTGMISNDGNLADSSPQSVLSNFAGDINGTAIVPVAFILNGAVTGSNTIFLANSANSAATFQIGSTAGVGGNQNWSGVGTSGTSAVFDNRLTDSSRWTGTVAFSDRGNYGTLEASTSTTAPSNASHYQFTSLTLSPVLNSTTGLYKLVNATQNDGGTGAEAFYAGALSIGGGIGDSSNGHYLFNLNGQSLYLNSFADTTGLTNRGLTFQNDALNTVSEIRAVTTTGGTLQGGGSFQVLNGATLQYNGGDVNNVIFTRNTGTIAADTAAAPNAGNGTSPNNRQTLAYNGVSGTIGTFTSFLGSGTDTGGNSNTTNAGTNGTLRIIGGSYASSGYILNPIGSIGVIDTTGAGDTTLNNVTIQGNGTADTNGAGNSTTFPALVVAGTTSIIGNLVLADASGAANQATLRVGGVTPSITPSALSTALLNVVGDLTVGATNNLAIQSNGTVKVGGNVSIAGVGINMANNVTGLGVGIDAASDFTLNGNKGSASAQTVNIVPSVGKFHVGDGSAGVLSGTAAQATLAANLTAATSVDINGAASSLNLGGHTLNISGGSGLLTVGGMLVGTGTVNGSISVLSGGTHGPGNSPGFQAVTGDASYAAGSNFAWDLTQNVAVDSIQSGAAPFDQVQVNGNLSITTGALFNITLNGSGSTVDFTNAFWAANEQWLVFGVNGTGTGDFTLGTVSVDSLGHGSSSYGYFDVANVGGDVYLNWTAVPEPSTTALVVGMGVGFWLLRLRRRK